MVEEKAIEQVDEIKITPETVSVVMDATKCSHFFERDGAGVKCRMCQLGLYGVYADTEGKLIKL